MHFDPQIVAVANKLRKEIQRSTKTIDDGESIALLLWYTFIQDHASFTGHNPKELSHIQLQAFLEIAGQFTQVREH